MDNADKRISMFNNKNEYYNTYVIDKLYDNHIGYT